MTVLALRLREMLLMRAQGKGLPAGIVDHDVISLTRFRIHTGNTGIAQVTSVFQPGID